MQTQKLKKKTILHINSLAVIQDDFMPLRKMEEMYARKTSELDGSALCISGMISYHW